MTSFLRGAAVCSLVAVAVSQRAVLCRPAVSHSLSACFVSLPTQAEVSRRVDTARF